jgi:hypothetical protein
MMNNFYMSNLDMARLNYGERWGYPRGPYQPGSQPCLTSGSGPSDDLVTC